MNNKTYGELMNALEAKEISLKNNQPELVQARFKRIIEVQIAKATVAGKFTTRFLIADGDETFFTLAIEEFVFDGFLVKKEEPVSVLFSEYVLSWYL